MEMTYLQAPLHRYTFSVKPIREWVESHCKGRVLNLFAGTTHLNVDEFRVDLDPSTRPNYGGDAYEYVEHHIKTLGKINFLSWDTIILDPPYSYRKSMEMYGGRKMSRFNALKDLLPSILKEKGIIITFGYHSISMGKSRGFEQTELLVISHGGAIHDTLCVVERKVKNV